MKSTSSSRMTKKVIFNDITVLAEIKKYIKKPKEEDKERIMNLIIEWEKDLLYLYGL